MKKDKRNLQTNNGKNNKNIEIINTDDLLFLHFDLVKNNSYPTYVSFIKKNALEDFSELLTKIFNKKGE